MIEEKFQLNIALCDDDPVMLRRLEEMSRRILGEDYALHFTVGTSPQDLLNAGAVFDIALLDVMLLEASGIQLAREILQKNPGCRIIFLSGYVRVVSEVYDVPHFCFILKEQLDSCLPKFLLRAAGLCAQEAGEKIRIQAREGIRQLPLKQILFMERRGHWTYITLADGSTVETREKISELKSRIRSGYFVRCHVSYLVNLQYVRLLKNRTLYLQDGRQIPVSLPHEQEVREAFFRTIAE